MQQPQGFIDPAHPVFFCKLNKSLYGLKQAPRAWFARLSSYLYQLGVKSSISDTSFFIWNTSTEYTILLVYVDDVLIK